MYYPIEVLLWQLWMLIIPSSIYGQGLPGPLNSSGSETPSSYVNASDIWNWQLLDQRKPTTFVPFTGTSLGEQGMTLVLISHQIYDLSSDGVYNTVWNYLVGIIDIYRTWILPGKMYQVQIRDLDAEVASELELSNTSYCAPIIRSLSNILEKYNPATSWNSGEIAVQFINDAVESYNRGGVSQRNVRCLMGVWNSTVSVVPQSDSACDSSWYDLTT